MTINVRAETVDIDSLQAHPKNPRLGDIAAIAESLEVNGQYSPIVVHGKTVIAGTHTWKAAKSLGWKKIAVTYFEGTDDEALQVLITDNRTSDISMYDNSILLDLLRSVSDLEGTGYDKSFLDELDGLYKEASGGVAHEPLLENEKTNETDETGEKKILFRLGFFAGELENELYGIWEDSLKDSVGGKKSAIVKEIRSRLDIPTEPKPKKPSKGSKKAQESAQDISMKETTLEPISSLKRYPANPREGDVGAISESLRVLGQYRPIVVNKRNNQILKGNHTVAAASALGWKEVAIVWVDVDDDAATKIVLADNRIADKATYDAEMLISALKSLTTLEGTGYDEEDFNDVLSGKNPTPKSPKIKFQIGDYKFSITEDIYNSWSEDVAIPKDAMHRLGLPLGALKREGN